MKFSFLLLFLLIISCSLNFNTEAEIKKFSIIEKITEKQIEKKIKKTLLYSKENYLYILAENNIYIYENNKLINKIGGIGFEKNNFSIINDFALSSAGKLFVLDGLQKEIKIFDKKGSWLKTVELKFCSYPILFDMANDDSIYIYDQDKGEILIFKDISKKYDFSFGKFDFQNPTSLVINDNRVIVNTASKTTVIYDLLGQLISAFDTLIQISYGNIFEEDKSMLKCNGKIILMFSYPANSFLIKEDILINNFDNKTVAYKIIYE